MVLRIQWLERLGDVVFNLEDLTMAFTLPDGDRYNLIGDRAGLVKQVGLYALIHLVTSGQPTGVLFSVSCESNNEDHTLHLTLLIVCRIIK